MTDDYNQNITHQDQDDEQGEAQEQSDYADALDCLLVHQASSKDDLQKTAARRTRTIQDMKIYLRRIGLADFPSNIDVVHITGTKGKGSTACLCESILRRHHGKRTGLFTSPHLVDIRERIRINGQPVSQDVFGQVYWEVRTRLEESATRDRKNNHNNNNNNGVENIYEDDPDLPDLPGYFRMLTLMALFTFAKYLPKIDVIILEVGMGGRYDATNVLDRVGRNVVCGVTLLDLDHVRVLGNTLEQIAWEKGGIFQDVKGAKTATNIVVVQSDGDNKLIDGTTATDSSTTTSDDAGGDYFFVLDSNIPSVIAVFKKCAQEESSHTRIARVGQCTKTIPDHVAIGLPGSHQRSNAELAVALCEAVMRSSMSSGNRKRKHTESLYEALEHASWPGRCQTVALEGAALPTNIRLDGSQTPLSVQAGYEWFSSVCRDTVGDHSNKNKSNDNSNTVATTKRILLFYCSHERDPVELLKMLCPEGEQPIFFDNVFFCQPDFVRPSAVTIPQAQDLLRDHNMSIQTDLLPDTTSNVTWQQTLGAIWKHLELNSKVNTKSEILVDLTVGSALNLIKDISTTDDSGAPLKIEVLAAGSLYLVGSILSAIGWTEKEADGIISLR